MKIYLASDHAGFELKEKIELFLQEAGITCEDCGPHLYDPADDYPALIATAAKKVSEDIAAGSDSKAVVLGASGQGEAIVANKFKHVRAVVYYGEPHVQQKDMSGKELGMISSTREHNDANVLSLGARFLSDEEAEKVVMTWITTAFSNEERHARRIRQIETIS
ncbi:MAG: RpiB/LacA/LacB family sugar-phosphate isomerase [Minisyncoccia bacterium]